MALDANPQSQTMNSYVTTAEADDYFSTKYDFYDSENGGSGFETWANFSQEKKEGLLISATRILDSWRYAGLKSVRTQPLMWPRQLIFDFEAVMYSPLVVPPKMKQATCEMAYWIWNQSERMMDDWSAEQFSNFEVGPLKLQTSQASQKISLLVLDLIRSIGPGVLLTAGHYDTSAKRISR